MVNEVSWRGEGGDGWLTWFADVCRLFLGVES